MKLATAEVRRYRSIEESGAFDVNDDVTCLVGKKESGKTAVLQALYKSSPVDRAKFDEGIDYPSRLTRERKGDKPIKVTASGYLRITKTGEQNASLTPEGATLVEGFTGGGVGRQALPQRAPLQTVIDALNDRLGGILTDADKLWVQQSFEFAAEDDTIAAAAKVNTEDNFGCVFDGQFQDLVLTRHDQNAELIARVFADTETTDFFTRLARKAVWEMARQAGGAPDSASA